MVFETLSKVHADACTKQPSEYYAYTEYKVEYGDIDRYKIRSFLGKGKYSQVFEGVDSEGGRCVIKVLKPVRNKKILREILILKRLLGADNVVQMVDVVRDRDGNSTGLVFGYEEHEDTRSLFKTFTLDDVRYYSREILRTLEHCHSRGIIHRDIKPHNLIINHKMRRVKIIDWGLAEFYLPKFQYNVRVASTHYKAPELLVNYKTYDYGLDLWAFGCVFAEMVFSKGPFFHGNSNDSQLLQIVQVLGSERFVEYLHAYQIPVKGDLLSGLKGFPGKSWESILFSRECLLAKHEREEHRREGLAENELSETCAEAFEMLSSLLVFDHMERASAQQALDLRFFKSPCRSAVLPPRL
jgi:casein kinase II subunit alpha